MATAEEKLDALSGQMKSMLQLMETFNRWHPDIDKFATNLSKDLKDLTSRIEVLEAQPTHTPPPAPKREEEGWAGVGHGVHPQPQGLDGKAIAFPQPLANGQFAASTSNPPESNVLVPHCNGHHHHHKEFRLLKADFPKFDGSHPRVWKENAKKYFDMFDVLVHHWAPFSTLHFKGIAHLWLQTYEAQHRVDNWVELCIAIETKFGKDLYQNSMQDLLNIKQLTTVQEYYDRFVLAMHKVLVHNSNLDDVFFVSKFLQGLHPDIHAALVLHKPRTVDLALSLALLQETVMETPSKSLPRRPYKEYNKY